MSPENARGYLAGLAIANEFEIQELRSAPVELKLRQLWTLMMSADLFENATQRETEVCKILVKLPAVEDLLIMKAIAQRPQDLRDIEGLLDAHPDADVDVVRKWVREFSNAVTMPDLLEEFEKLLAGRRPRP